MQYFLLGLATLALVLVIAQAFVKANPATLAQRLRKIAGVAAFAAAGFALVRGTLAYAFPLALLGGWLLWGQGAAPWGGWPGWGSRRPVGPRASRPTISRWSSTTTPAPCAAVC